MPSKTSKIAGPIIHNLVISKALSYLYLGYILHLLMKFLVSGKDSIPETLQRKQYIKTLLRLNNRLNNKNRLSERERSTACSQYLDDDDLSDSTSERGFGCTGIEL